MHFAILSTDEGVVTVCIWLNYFIKKTAAGISFSKFRKQRGPQLELGVWDESVQKHIHCVCLWWASWTTFFFFSNIEITYQDCLEDDCGQIAFNIPLWYEKKDIWNCINMLQTPLISSSWFNKPWSNMPWFHIFSRKHCRTGTYFKNKEEAQGSWNAVENQH